MSLILDALKRLEGRRVLRPIAAPVEQVSVSRLQPPPPAGPPVSRYELSEACETTTVTIEPTPIVLGREMAISPPMGELPSALLEEVEELRREVAAALRDSAPTTLPLIEPAKPKRKLLSRAVCHLPVATDLLAPYRLIRDRIMAPAASSRSAMLLLTSPADSDVASLWPLAVACGERGQDVLFVDASLESSLVRSYPTASSPLGIDDVLEGRMSWDDVIRPTTAANVSLLAQGKNPARAETSEVSLWDDLRQQFSLVLVAAGPGQSPSALWLAPLCDATYLVIELGASERVAAVKAQQSLQACGANLLGCIVLASKAA